MIMSDHAALPKELVYGGDQLGAFWKLSESRESEATKDIAIAIWVTGAPLLCERPRLKMYDMYKNHMWDQTDSPRSQKAAMWK